MKKYDYETQKYIDEVNKISDFKMGEMRKLFELIKKGDSAAKNRLIEGYLKLVVQIAKEYADNGVELLELIQYGNEGLLKAINRFDENYEGNFYSDINRTIRKNIEKNIKIHNSIIKTSPAFRYKLNNYKEFLNNLTIKLGHDPSIEEISKYSNYTLKEIQELNTMGEQPELFSDLKGENLVSETETDEIIEHLHNQEFIRLLTYALDEQSLMILIYYYGLNNHKTYTLEKIGNIYNVVEERIRQIIARAFQRIRMVSRLFFDKNVSFKELSDFKRFNTNNKHTILDLLNNDDEQVIKNALNNLSEEEQQLLAKRYSPDLKEVISKDISINELCYIYDVILPKLNQSLMERNSNRLG